MKVFAVGVGIVVLLVAVPVAAIALDATVGQNDTAKVTATMPRMSSAGAGGMMAAQPQPVAASAADQLTIVHVQKGCHVWANGTSQMPMTRLTLKVGQMLRIMNQDVDMHRLMQLAGPRMMLGGAMKQGQAQTLTFTKPGSYRFDTKVSPMAGMPEVSTTGTDNTLRLTVTVV